MQSRAAVGRANQKGAEPATGERVHNSSSRSQWGAPSFPIGLPSFFLFFLVVPPTLHWRRSIDEKRLALMQNSNEKGAVPRPRKGSAGRVALLLSLSLPSNGVTEFFFIGSTTLDPGCPKKGLPFMQNVNKKGAVPQSKGFLWGPY